MNNPLSTLVYFSEIENTNTEIMTNRSSYKDGDGVYTTHQRSGKGTRGRLWQESKGKSLAISFLYNLPHEALPPLPLIVGLAVAKAIRDYAQIEVSLKWSNDLIAQGKKLVGILCESRLEAGCARVVMGVGINLFQGAEELLEEGLSQAISLAMLGKKEIDPRQLAEGIQKEIQAYMAVYFKFGFQGALLQEYEQRCLTIGQELEIIRPNQPVERGYGVGVSPQGALRCLSPEGEEFLLYSGDVSVRRLDGRY